MAAEPISADKELLDKMNFDKMDGLIPAVVQDHQTLVVLTVGFFSRESLKVTLETGKVTFFSRTRSKLWTKGETSGNFLVVKKIVADCDSDTLLIKATPLGPACHLGFDNCFNEAGEDFIDVLSKVIRNRIGEPKRNSYISSLHREGPERIAQKVGEEAVEVVIEAIKGDEQGLLEEAADLFFHLLVLLESKKLPFRRIIELLKTRHKKYERDSG